MKDLDAVTCAACHDSGWVPFTRIVRGHRLPWSAACLCDKGMRLSTPREWPPGRKLETTIGPPVVVEPIDREIYYERLRKAAEL